MTAPGGGARPRPKTSSASSNIAICVSIETPAGLCLFYKGREAGGETINSLVCDLLVSRAGSLVKAFSRRGAG